MLLYSTNKLLGFKVKGKNEELGEVKGFLFNSETWDLEYLTIERGTWPMKKEFNIPIDRLGIPENFDECFHSNLSLEEMIDLDFMASQKLGGDPGHPISSWRAGEYRQRIPWLAPLAISALFKKRSQRQVDSLEREEVVKTLRNYDEIQGFQVNAQDDEMGEVTDLIIDADLWVIRYVIIERSEEGRIMLPSSWVKKVNPSAESVDLILEKKLVLDSPYVIG